MTNENSAASGAVGRKKEKLVSDLKVVAADTNDLLNELTNASTEEFLAARHRIEARLSGAIADLDSARVETARKVKRAARASYGYARDNPWTLAGVLAIGVAALLLSRCSGRDHRDD